MMTGKLTKEQRQVCEYCTARMYQYSLTLKSRKETNCEQVMLAVKQLQQQGEQAVAKPLYDTETGFKGYQYGGSSTKEPIKVPTASLPRHHNYSRHYGH